MKDGIIIIGGGVQLPSTIDIIEKEGKYRITGIVDSKAEVGRYLHGYKVIGRQQELKKLVEEYEITGGIISAGDNWVRKIIYDDVIKSVPYFNFINAIHPSVIIGNNVKIGKGVILMAGGIVNPGAIIGDFAFFSTSARVEHDCIIHDFASMATGSAIGGLVELGKYSAITLGVTVVDRVVIGENTVIGSGSLILKDVPDNVLVYGNPGKIVRERKRYERYLSK